MFFFYTISQIVDDGTHFRDIFNVISGKYDCQTTEIIFTSMVLLIYSSTRASRYSVKKRKKRWKSHFQVQMADKSSGKNLSAEIRLSGRVAAGSLPRCGTHEQLNRREVSFLLMP